MPGFNLEDYETVDSRIKRFYRDHPSGRIITDLVGHDGEPGRTRWVVKAAVFRDTDREAPDGTGLAFELDGAGMANKTSALENCETSAIGRALANIGYSGDRRASREEMAKTQQPVRKPDGWKVKIAQAQDMAALNVIFSEARSGGWADQETMSALTARKKALHA